MLLSTEELISDLAGIYLFREVEDVAHAASTLLEAYRKIAPFGKRLLSTPPSWVPVHRELFLLLQYHAGQLEKLLGEARTILQGFGRQPEKKELPRFRSDAMLSDLIQHFDQWEPIRALPDNRRSLFPLHTSELIQTAKQARHREKWISEQPDRSEYVPFFLWETAASLAENLYCPHLTDKSSEEPGLLSLLTELIENTRSR